MPEPTFQLIRDDGFTSALKCGQVTFVLQDGRFRVIAEHDDRHVWLNVRIGDGKVEFHKGCPDDLKKALLTLTGVDNPKTLTGFARQVVDDA